MNTLLQKVLNEKVLFGAVCCKIGFFVITRLKNHEMNAQILVLFNEKKMREFHEKLNFYRKSQNLAEMVNFARNKFKKKKE